MVEMGAHNGGEFLKVKLSKVCLFDTLTYKRSIFQWMKCRRYLYQNVAPITVHLNP